MQIRSERQYSHFDESFLSLSSMKSVFSKIYKKNNFFLMLGARVKLVEPVIRQAALVVSFFKVQIKELKFSTLFR